LCKNRGDEAAACEVAEETGIVVGSHALPRSHLRDWRMRNLYEIYPVWRHRYAPVVTHNTEQVFGLQLPRFVPV
jgi:dATP pyrophosphohydrolase